MKELVEIAIAAYRARRYQDAIELLVQATDLDAHNYGAKLYLVMAYERAGRIVDAHRLLKRMVVDCPDEQIRKKAESWLPSLDAEMRRRFNKPPLKQNIATNNNAQDSDDIVWVG